MYKNVLFDLDGTLLPMNMKKFIELYLAAFCKRFSASLEIPADLLVKAIWTGSAAMGRNDGQCLNSELFWKSMNRFCNRDMRRYEEDFNNFYRNEFIAAKAAVGQNPLARKSVELLREQGVKLVVATNPIFPKAATYRRIEWAGLDVNDFEYITVYDNSSACKPNLNYFEEICSICGIHPEESLMVGNDVDEDMVASRLGFDTFLVTDCLINRRNKSLDTYRNGSFEDFYSFLITRI